MRQAQLRPIWNAVIAITAAILCAAPIVYAIFVAKDPVSAPSAISRADKAPPKDATVQDHAPR